MTRECGDCTLCCKVMHIPELDKPRDQWCPNVVPNKGCAIYSERPQSCRTFRCLWLMDSSLDETWKPNMCHMVLYPEPGSHLVVHVDNEAHEPWKQEPYLSVLRNIAAKGLDAGRMVVILENGEATVILPDRGVTLGKLERDDRIVMGKVKTETGTRIEVAKVKVDQMAAYRAARSGATKPET